MGNIAAQRSLFAIGYWLQPISKKMVKHFQFLGRYGLDNPLEVLYQDPIYVPYSNTVYPSNRIPWLLDLISNTRYASIRLVLL